MNNQNFAMRMKIASEMKEATPHLLTKFDRILLPVYKHAIEKFTDLHIDNATDKVPSLMADNFKDLSDFWEVQEALLKVYLTGLSKLVNIDGNHLRKIFTTMSDSDFEFMLVAFEKARHQFFIFDEPSCCICHNVADAFALLSDTALELIYKYTTEM